MKKLVKLLRGKLRALVSKDQYKIKKGYKSRKVNAHHDDTSYSDEYQKEVYLTAKRLMIENKLTRVVDFGCGSGYKLINDLGEFDTVGIEISPTFEYLKKTYPDRKWLNAKDLEKENLTCDLIISSDVIEHVANPDEFLRAVQKVNNFQYFIISTPDRDIINGWSDYGPPKNDCHIREWNGREFKRYIAQFFDVVSHQVTHYSDGTQMIICKKRTNDSTH